MPTSDKPVTPPEGPEDPRAAFLMRAAELLHAQGTPTPRLEEVLGVMARKLDIEGQFFALPTSLFMGLGPRGRQVTHVLRVEPGEVDLGKLVDLDEALDEVTYGDLGPRGGLARIERVAARPPRYRGARTVVAFGAASAAASVFFGASRVDLVAAALFGLATGGAALWAARHPAFARVFDIAVSFFVAAAAALVAPLVPGLSVEVVTLGGLIVLLPGLMLTIAMTELAARHWVAGTARLAGATTALLSIGIGVALGLWVGTLPHTGAAQAVAAASPLPAWSELVALAVAPLAFAVLLRARARDFLAIWLVGALGYAGARLGVARLGPELGAFLGALLVGVASNVRARWRRTPASVTIVPGLLLLVPGAIGFRSVRSFLAHDALSGADGAVRVALIGATLAGGLLVAGALAPPRRAL